MLEHTRHRYRPPAAPAARADGHAPLRAAGLAAARARGFQARLVRRARARGVGPRGRPGVRVRGPGGRPACRCSTSASIERAVLVGPLDGRRHRDARRARAAGARQRARADHARLRRRALPRTTPTSPTGTGSRPGSRPTARTASCACSSRPPDERWREPVLKFTRQRIERHRHPEALADAVRVVPRSAAFDGLDRLAEIDVPALVVGSRDESDPTHPLRWPRSTRAGCRGAELVIEDAGRPAARLAGRAALARDPRLAQPYRTEPSLTIVAPSSTATS